MDPDRENAATIARRYFGVTEPLKELGWGISGYVYLSPDMRTAVKGAIANGNGDLILIRCQFGHTLTQPSPTGVQRIFCKQH